MTIDEGPGGVPEQDPEAARKAATAVQGPGIALIVLGALSLVGSLLILAGAGRLTEARIAQSPAEWRELLEHAKEWQEGPYSKVYEGGLAVIEVLMILGGIRMLQMRSYGLAFAAAILAMVNLQCCCCLPGIGFGIWAIVVLVQPDVKAAFRS